MAGEITALIAQLNQYRASDNPEPVRVDIDLLTTALAAILAGTDISFTGPLSLASGQIAFPATQNPSADPNTLDDYEQGTFTVTLGDGTNNFTAVANTGYYTKIGNACVIAWLFSWNAIGAAGAPQLTLGGIPFASNSDAGYRTGLSLGRIEGLDATATLNQITANIGTNSTTAAFWRTNDNAAATALPANGSSAAGLLIGGFAYHTN